MELDKYYWAPVTIDRFGTTKKAEKILGVQNHKPWTLFHETGLMNNWLVFILFSKHSSVT